MPDRALQNAMSRRDTLQARIAELRQEISECEQGISEAVAFIQQWHLFAGTHDGETEPVPSGAVAETKPSMPRVSRSELKNPRKEDVAEAAREIISKRGKPISRPELLKLLAERGVTIRGTRPETVLTTMLWRMKDRIMHIPRMGYWPTDQLLPGTGVEHQKALLDALNEHSHSPSG